MSKQQPAPELPKELARCITQLSSADAEERRLAQLSLRALGPRALVSLLHAFHQIIERENSKWYVKLYGLLSSISHIPMLVTLMVLALSGLGSSKMRTALLSRCAKYADALWIRSLQKNANISAAQTSLLEAIAQFDDVRATGVMAVGLCCTQPSVQKLCEERLIRLLPRFNSNVSELLVKHEQQYLLAMIRLEYANNHFECVAQILKAMAHTRNNYARQLTERLLDEEASTPNEVKLQALAYATLSNWRRKPEKRNVNARHA